MKLPILSSLSVLLLVLPTVTRAQSADHFFLGGATNYLQTNIDQAKRFVTNGLSLYPQDQKLTNLWALLNREQQHQPEQEDKKDEQQKSESEKKDEQAQQEKQEQQGQDQQQKEQQADQKDQQQKAEDQRGAEPDQNSEQAATSQAMQMTPQQAQQLLEALKADEKAMIFLPQNVKTNRPNNRVFKDW